MNFKKWIAAGAMCLTASFQIVLAQDAPQPVAPSAAPVVLTLKRAIELALQNSKDIQLAKIQMRVADDTASVTNSEFRPNLYAGSGAGYTYGLPETPGGRPPAIFNLTYTQSILDGPLRGLLKEQQEHARAQRLQLEDTRNVVMVRVASAYLELVKVRHSLDLLRKKRER